MTNRCAEGHPRIQNKSGRWICKQCRAAHVRKHYQANKDAINRKRREDPTQRDKYKTYYSRNADKKKAYSREYVKKNRERIAERQKNHYERNKEHILKRERERRHPLESTYYNMLNRCYNPNNKSYRNYGGRKSRPIKIDSRWLGEDGFKNFVEDMYEFYQKGLTLEREDNTDNYSPANCKWATRKEQQNNTRANVKNRLRVPDNTTIEYDGRTMTLKDFADMVVLNLDVVKYRYTAAIEQDKISIADFILNPLIEGRIRRYGDMNYTLTELSLISGLSNGTIRVRLDKLRWTVKQAVETKSQRSADNT